MALAKALMRKGMAYFLVADDWQSIYRFTGSQVRLFNKVHDYLGFTKRVDLTETFRFSDDIAQPSARFVQQNPVQTRRALKSVNPQGDGGLTVIADGDQRQGARTALYEIRARRRSGRQHIDPGGDSEEAGRTCPAGRKGTSRPCMARREERPTTS